MKIKPIKIILWGYGSGVLIGFIFSAIGISTNSKIITEIGLICFLVGFLIGSIPLIGSLCYLFLKKCKSVLAENENKHL